MLKTVKLFFTFCLKHICRLVSYEFCVKRSCDFDFTGSANNRSRVLKYCHFKFASAKAQQIIIELHFAGGLKPFGKFRKVQPALLGWRNLNRIASAQHSGKITGTQLPEFQIVPARRCDSREPVGRD